MKSSRSRSPGVSDALLHAATLYHREARKCVKGNAYLAAVVMQVAALEATLQSMCAIYLDGGKENDGVPGEKISPEEE